MTFTPTISLSEVNLSSYSDLVHDLSTTTPLRTTTTHLSFSLCLLRAVDEKMESPSSTGRSLAANNEQFGESLESISVAPSATAEKSDRLEEEFESMTVTPSVTEKIHFVEERSETTTALDSKLKSQHIHCAQLHGNAKSPEHFFFLPALHGHFIRYGGDSSYSRSLGCPRSS